MTTIEYEARVFYETWRSRMALKSVPVLSWEEMNISSREVWTEAVKVMFERNPQEMVHPRLPDATATANLLRSFNDIRNDFELMKRNYACLRDSYKALASENNDLKRRHKELNEKHRKLRDGDRQRLKEAAMVEVKRAPTGTTPINRKVRIGIDEVFRKAEAEEPAHLMVACGQQLEYVKILLEAEEVNEMVTHPGFRHQRKR